MGKGSGSPPPAPDYGAAAEKQAQSQMTTQYTPYGSQVYSRNTNSPSGWVSRIKLDPDAQATLDAQMGLSRGLAGIAGNQLPGIAEQYSSPMDLSSVGQIADKAYGAFSSRLDPQWAAREESQHQRLANQGLTPGGEAYDNAMREFNQSRNDAYQQANLGAIQTMPQTYQLASAAYNQPLNTLNALRTGAQVQNPQFGGGGQGANYLGAAQAQGQYGQGLYNADIAQQNALTSGLFGLGAAGMMAISDRRLKSNIKRVGTHRLGIGIYEYDIGGRRERGVMADEVENVVPDAVIEIGGFKAVDYGRL